MRHLSGFSLSFQKLGFSLAKRENPASPAEAQEGRHQWFPPSDFLPFPKIIWCKPETGDRCEKENGRGFFLSCRSLTIRNVRYLAATQAVSSQQARHTRAAQLVSLDMTDSTCEFIYLEPFSRAGAVYYHVPTNCAALLCRTLR